MSVRDSSLVLLRKRMGSSRSSSPVLDLEDHQELDEVLEMDSDSDNAADTSSLLDSNPNEQVDEDGVSKIAGKNRKLGFVYIWTVAVIWVGASYVVKGIEDKVAVPFFLTYACTALFSILLPISYMTGSLQRAIRNNEELPIGEEKGKSLREIIRASLMIFPLWFLANFLYNFSLHYTTVTSSTILSGTSAIFTLGLGAFLKSETVTIRKALGVGACVLGTSLVGLADKGTSSSSSTLGGDFASLLSAFFYACYSLAVDRSFPDGDKSVDMAVVLGCVGVISIVTLTPCVMITHFSGIESLGNVTMTILGWIVINGLVNNVLSDYLWARAVLLTSPVITTVGLSLTVPMSIVGDFIVYGLSPSILTLFGAVFVTGGFIAVSVVKS